MAPGSKRLSWATTARLVLAGWHPNRNVWDRLKLPTSFDPFPEARRILVRFGGLKFGDRNEHTRLDPSAGDEESDRIIECEQRLGRRLYPVGYSEHQDREYFLVDEAGVVYLLAGDTLRPLASSFEKALDRIVRRRTWRRDVDGDLTKLGLAEKVWQLDERP